MPVDEKEPIFLDFDTEGFVTCPWWTKEAQEILEKVGTHAPGYEHVNSNPWCG